MGDTVTGQEVVETPKDPEDMYRQVKSDVSISEVHHEVERAIINKEELDEAAQTLENIHHTSVTLEHDAGLARGMHLACTKVVGTALDNPADPLAFYNANPEASMESFVGSIKETIAKIWQAIVNFFKKITEAIKSFFKRLFGGVSNQREWIDKLKSRINQIKKSEYEASTAAVHLSKASLLAIDGELNPDNVMRGANAVDTVLVGNYDKFVEDHYSGYENLLDWFKKGDSSKIDLLWRIVNRKNEQREKLLEQSMRKATLPGCMTLKMIFATSNRDFPMPTRYEVGKAEKCKDYRGNGTMFGMNIDKLEELLSLVEGVVDVVEKHEDTINEIESLREATKKAADDWLDSAEKSAIDGVLTKMDIRSALRIATNSSIKGLVSINEYLYKYSSATLELIDKNLDRYK